MCPVLHQLFLSKAQQQKSFITSSNLLLH
jgi:hypothetical protein